MPKTRAQRCVYKESGRRCVRDGIGEPALCRAHRVAFDAVAATQDAPAAKRVLDLFDDFLNGKAVNTSDVLGAAQDFFSEWSMGGGVAAGYHPPIDHHGQTEHDEHGRSRFRPPPNWQGSWPGANGPRYRPAPPPPDPQAELERRARQVLGFAASEPLTEDVIAKRRRELAKRHHPDRGGSASAMSQINDAADVLFASLS